MWRESRGQQMRTAHHVGSEWWRPDVAVGRSDRGEAHTAAAAKVSDSAVPFWALMTFTFILLLAPQSYFPALVPFRIALLTAAVAVITHVYDRLSHRQPIVHLTGEMWITLCLVGWAILTVPMSLRPGGSLSFLFEVYLKTLVVFWLLSNVVNTLTRLRQVVWVLTVMTVPMAATALDNFISGTFLQGSNRIVGYEAPLTGNPNDLALMLNLILPLSVALFLIARRTLVRTVLLVVIALDVIAVVVTFSRGGFLTLATIIVMYLWKLRKRLAGGWAWSVLVVALACLPLLPSGYFDRLSTITNIESDSTGSAQERWRAKLAAANLVVQNPIVGVGVGMNTLALNEERGHYSVPVHNVYLVYAVELGILGLVLFLMLLAGCMKSAISVQQRSASVRALRELFYLAEGIQISLIAFAVAALFDPCGYDVSFYYIAGLAVAVRAAYETESSNAALDQNQPSPYK